MVGYVRDGTASCWVRSMSWAARSDLKCQQFDLCVDSNCNRVWARRTRLRADKRCGGALAGADESRGCTSASVTTDAPDNLIQLQPGRGCQIKTLAAWVHSSSFAIDNER